MKVVVTGWIVDLFLVIPDILWSGNKRIFNKRRIKMKHSFFIFLTLMALTVALPIMSFAHSGTGSHEHPHPDITTDPVPCPNPSKEESSECCRGNPCACNDPEHCKSKDTGLDDLISEAAKGEALGKLPGGIATETLVEHGPDFVEDNGQDIIDFLEPVTSVFTNTWDTITGLASMFTCPSDHYDFTCGACNVRYSGSHNCIASSSSSSSSDSQTDLGNGFYRCNTCRTTFSYYDSHTCP